MVSVEEVPCTRGGATRKGNKNNFHCIIWLQFLFQNVDPAYELMTVNTLSTS